MLRCWTLLSFLTLVFAVGHSTAVAQGWGSVEGQFILDGAIPALDPLVVKGDKAAKDPEVCAVAGVPNESLVVNSENNGIANICLYLRKAPSSIHPDLASSAEDEVEFDQKGCLFLPHVIIVRTDQKVRLVNSDAIQHNVRTSPFANDPKNLILPPNDKVGTTIDMPQPELRTPPVKVSCDIHAWMTGYWMVTDHPYVAVTDADGKFTIKNLPAGKHTFRVWHETAGYVETPQFKRDLEVTIEDGKTLTLDPIKVPVAEFDPK